MSEMEFLKLGTRSKKGGSTESHFNSFIVIFLSTIIDGFHGDVTRLQSQKSEVLRIVIYTRLKINRK